MLYSSLRPLFGLVWHASPRLFLATLGLTIIGGLVPIATIFLSAKLLDALVQAGRASQLSLSSLPSYFVTLIALFALLQIAERLTNTLRSSVQGLFQTRVSDFVERRIADKAASLDLARFENPDFHNKMTTASAEASYRPLEIVMQLMQACAAATMLISVTVILGVWRLWLPPTILVTALLSFLVAAHYAKAQADLVIGRMPLSRKKSYISSLLTGDWAVKEVRLFGLQPHLLKRLRSLQETVYIQDKGLEQKRVLATIWSELLLSLATAALVGYCGVAVLTGIISIGDFSLYSGAIFQFQAGLLGVLMSLSQIRGHLPFISSLNDFLATQAKVEAPRSSKNAVISDYPRLEFRNVSFRYTDTDPYSVRNLSFVVEAGEKIALVGENGAGKTTLVKLLSGLYEPTQGQILLDGVDIKTLERERLRSYLGVIFQDYLIYHMPLHINIALGKPAALNRRERVLRAAHSSGLESLVKTLPQGYHTVLERFIDRGHELSGGQRQLVAITRALMRDAPVLILDEPTAALDPQAEETFFEQLLTQQAYQRKTVFLISHRFSTIRRAERILVLDKGQLIEQGAHDDLLRLGGHYAKLFRLQAKLYQDEPPQPVSTLAAQPYG